ncbi:hypothetical protein [Mycobacterium shimoidei]|uniref:VOC domain-containing protein n=1 Tax=Mycobacterium shimoidei TaxID=29313 RepID=A0A1E3TCW0_MYCSH|nr:hypothetical protein [Mycobacterium shimoidei]MCV7258502.1 glyoxalase [Mycobacterium shimoidei]ODR12270.1 hypothetical protein BHQ16_16340 [Mycobacterium shimoidei]ORW78388.1 hypothetical protein AWC26_17910 [Mycobacterium shimoidei]SRX92558.1 hypothetical protein [Bradyrhizobium japonicum USDA 6] [Mycobacterium shimoidei]
MDIRHTLTAIVPCTDLDASEEFYGRLGFSRSQSEYPADDHYRMLDDGRGAAVHLTRAVDELTARVADAIIANSGPEVKPWGMYEFALSDPDGTLVRVGWQARLRSQSP